jgi:hypothetical protein
MLHGRLTDRQALYRRLLTQASERKAAAILWQQ